MNGKKKRSWKRLNIKCQKSLGNQSDGRKDSRNEKGGDPIGKYNLTLGKGIKKYKIHVVYVVVVQTEQHWMMKAK